ncbi:protein of unknown function [Methanoculleus bourgensis]|uniref:Uncharacterized protein n=1 Tax=Methanoculleus bourgensis TaxID=83986 RepID=A0A0X3BPZ9_9EURY|nr:protein of unknown function [Methanoculleus bourgensis]
MYRPVALASCGIGDRVPLASGTLLRTSGAHYTPNGSWVNKPVFSNSDLSISLRGTVGPPLPGGHSQSVYGN